MDAYRAQLQSFDPDIADAIRGEERRQSDGVEMIPSENYTYPEVLAALGTVLESVRRLQAGLQSFLSMRRIDARRKNAKAFRLRHSQSLVKRRQRLSHAMVRSTIQRLGKTTNPLTRSERLTISTSRCGRTFASAFANFGP